MVFGLFGSKDDRDKKKVKDLQKKAQEKFGDPSVRTKALENLRDLGTPEAIAALLGRFSFRVDPGITDAEEKDYVFSMVTALGDDAIAPVKAFIQRNENVSWGLRCLEKLVGPEDMVETIVAVLDLLAKTYTRDPEKKVVLLNHLGQHQDARIGPCALQFVEDPADDVRCAVFGLVVKQKTAEAAGPLAGRATNDEAVRVRTAAAQALAELGTAVPAEQRPELAAKLSKGFTLGEDGVVRAA